MNTKRKLKVLSIRDKLKIIKEIDNVAKQFNIPPSTLTTILKNREKILAKSSTSENLNVKKLRNSNSEHVEEAVLTFLQQSRRANIPLSGAIIQEKARLYTSKFGIENFKASEGSLNSSTFEDFITIDEDLTTESILNDEEIISIINSENQEEVMSDAIYKDALLNEPIMVPTSKDCKNALEIIHNKLVSTPNVPSEIFDSFFKLHNFF